jgi:hypothetical protein
VVWVAGHPSWGGAVRPHNPTLFSPILADFLDV